jgi:hypothetical protein
MVGLGRYVFPRRPAERMVALAMVQAPGMLDEMVQLLRNCTHGAVAD